MLDWITITSYIEINNNNKERLLKIIDELKELKAISLENYEQLKTALILIS